MCDKQLFAHCVCLGGEFSALFLVRLGVIWSCRLFDGGCNVRCLFGFYIFNIPTRQNNISNDQRKRTHECQVSPATVHTHMPVCHYHITFCTNSEHPICYVSVESFTPCNADKRRLCNVIVFDTFPSADATAFWFGLSALVSPSVRPSLQLVWWSNELLTYAEYILSTPKSSTIYADFMNLLMKRTRKSIASSLSRYTMHSIFFWITFFGERYSDIGRFPPFHKL